MSNLFTVTTTTNTLRLDEKRQGEAVFTVFNAAGRPIRGRALLHAEDPRAEDWLSLAGDVERDFPIAGTEQYSVRITVPPEAPPGSYLFRLDMVGVERPDEDYTQGQTVTCEVPEAVQKKPFPAWIVLVGLGVLLLGGLMAYLLWPRERTTHERTTLLPDASLSVHWWVSQGGGSQLIDPDRYNFRVGVSRTEDRPPAGESISLVTFSSQGLSGDEIVFASLQLGTADVVGNPFANHGDLLIEEVSFADFMRAPHTFPVLNELFRLARPPIQPEEGVAEVLEVTQALKASLDRGSQRFQIRLRFEGVELEDVNAELAAPDSYVEWNHLDVHLRVSTRAE
ncbi:MAG: hypothetical protein WD645_01450 [Dehalococcoidia bacterium]